MFNTISVKVILGLFYILCGTPVFLQYTLFAGIVGFEVHNTITPQTITVDGDDLYKPISITQTAEDEVGNMATCIFQAVAVRK